MASAPKPGEFERVLYDVMHRLHATILFLASLVASVCGGCQFEQHRHELERLHAGGQYRTALSVLDSPQSKDLYSSGNRLLYLLDRGALLLAEGRDGEVISTLEEAEGIMDYKGKRNEGDDILEWLVNDGAAKYVGEPYEDMYVNVFKLLAELRSGQISGGATVEARRLGRKSDLLRGRFDSSRAALREKSGDNQKILAKSGMYGDESTAGQFIDSTLGTYLSAVAFMKANDRDMQSVAARRLVDAAKRQQQIVGPVDPERFVSLGDMPPESANVLLVAFSGRGPTKYAERIGPIPIGDVPVYFELPMLRSTPSRVAKVRATLTPDQPSEANPPQIVELNLIESMNGVATENHRRQLPVIYTRTLIRAAIRSGISFAVTETVRKNQGGARRKSDDEALVSLIAGMAMIALAERADLRCWAFLPGQAHAALASLPQGRFSATMDYLDSSGRVLYSLKQDNLDASSAPSALTTMIGHYWN